MRWSWTPTSSVRASTRCSTCPTIKGLSTAVDVRTVVHAMRLPKVSVVTAGPVPNGGRNPRAVHACGSQAERARGVRDHRQPAVVGQRRCGVARRDDRRGGAPCPVGSTSAEQLRQALDELDAVGVPVLGLVLTMGAKTARSYGRYGYGDGDKPRAGWDRLRSSSNAFCFRSLGAPGALAAPGRRDGPPRVPRQTAACDVAGSPPPLPCAPGDRRRL